MVHVLRHLKDSMENEPTLEWNKQMRGLMQEMIHYRNSLDSKDPPDINKIEEFKVRYKDILAVAQRAFEYCHNQPGKSRIPVPDRIRVQNTALATDGDR